MNIISPHNEMHRRVELNNTVHYQAYGFLALAPLALSLPLSPLLPPSLSRSLSVFNREHFCKMTSRHYMISAHVIARGCVYPHTYTQEILIIPRNFSLE